MPARPGRRHRRNAAPWRWKPGRNRSPARRTARQGAQGVPAGPAGRAAPCRDRRSDAGLGEFRAAVPGPRHAALPGGLVSARAMAEPALRVGDTRGQRVVRAAGRGGGRRGRRGRVARLARGRRAASSGLGAGGGAGPPVRPGASAGRPGRAGTACLRRPPPRLENPLAGGRHGRPDRGGPAVACLDLGPVRRYRPDARRHAGRRQPAHAQYRQRGRCPLQRRVAPDRAAPGRAAYRHVPGRDDACPAPGRGHADGSRARVGHPLLGAPARRPRPGGGE